MSNILGITFTLPWISSSGSCYRNNSNPQILLNWGRSPLKIEIILELFHATVLAWHRQIVILGALVQFFCQAKNLLKIKSQLLSSGTFLPLSWFSSNPGNIRKSIQQNETLNNPRKFWITLSKGSVTPFSTCCSSICGALLDLQIVQVSLGINMCCQITLAEVQSIIVQIKQCVQHCCGRHSDTATADPAAAVLLAEPTAAYTQLPPHTAAANSLTWYRSRDHGHHHDSE